MLTARSVSHTIFAASDMQKPGIAMIANTPAPYHTALYARLAREIPEFTVHSLFTRSRANLQWVGTMRPEIRPVQFASGRERAGQISFRFGRDLQKGRRIAGYLAEHNVHAVVLMGYSDLTRVWLCRYCRHRNIKLFLRGDSNIKGDRTGSIIRAAAKQRFVRWFLSNSDGVMPMGSYGERYFEKYGADRKKFFLVPHEPDYSLFTSVDGHELRRFRAQIGLVEGRRYLLYCGRLAMVKRVDLLLDAFARIASRRPGWDVLIVGDGPLREELKIRVPPALRDRVKWLGWFSDLDRVRFAYHAADVLVLPSDWEPWAVVVTEAAAAGLVVVASDVVGAAADLIQDGRNGRIFPSGNVESLTEALADVTDATALSRYRQAVPSALRAWRSRYDSVRGIREALYSVGLLPARL